MLVGFNYNNNEYFYSRDLTGNINKIIDINGIVKVEYKYDAWGKVLSITGDSTLKYVNSFLYKGYIYDFETSIYYCNSRYYDPLVLRWISIDEVSYLDSDSATGINLWCYCNNNPVMYSDEDGNFCFSILLLSIVIGVLVSVGKEYVQDVAQNLEDGFQLSDLNTFEDNWKKYVIASLEGAVIGAAFGIGAGLGVSAFAAGTRLTFGAISIALAGTTIGSFIAGIGIYTLETNCFGLKEFNDNDMWKYGAKIGIKAGLNCGMGMMLGNQGFYQKDSSNLMQRIFLKSTLLTPIYWIIDELL